MIAPPKIKDFNSYSFLYDKYAPALYGIILKLTPDEELAGSILEKSFAQIWKQLERNNGTKSGPFSAMLKITLQQCDKEVGIPKNFLSLIQQKPLSTGRPE